MRTIVVPGGNTCLRLYGIYRGANGTLATLTHTSQLVREALLDAEIAGMTAALFAGDLNLEMEQLACGPTLAVAGWEDIGHGHPTSAASSLRPRHIDFLLANKQMPQRAHCCQLGPWRENLPTLQAC